MRNVPEIVSATDIIPYLIFFRLSGSESIIAVAKTKAIAIRNRPNITITILVTVLSLFLYLMIWSVSFIMAKIFKN
jgi:hypothetical protein